MADRFRDGTIGVAADGDWKCGRRIVLSRESSGVCSADGDGDSGDSSGDSAITAVCFVVSSGDGGPTRWSLDVIGRRSDWAK